MALPGELSALYVVYYGLKHGISQFKTYKIHRLKIIKAFFYYIKNLTPTWFSGCRHKKTPTVREFWESPHSGGRFIRQRLDKSELYALLQQGLTGSWSFQNSHSVRSGMSHQLNLYCL